jgi:hypothetical protein
MFSYLLKLLTMGTIALVVMSCAGKTESYRYELTSALDTQLSGRHFVARRRGGLEDPKRKVSMYGAAVRHRSFPSHSAASVERFRTPNLA